MEKVSGTLWIGGWVGPIANLVMARKTLTLLGIETLSFNPQPITFLTLSRLIRYNSTEQYSLNHCVVWFHYM